VISRIGGLSFTRHGAPPVTLWTGQFRDLDPTEHYEDILHLHEHPFRVDDRRKM